MYECMYVSMHVFMCVQMYVCGCVGVCVCVYVCIYSENLKYAYNLLNIQSAERVYRQHV